MDETKVLAKELRKHERGRGKPRAPRRDARTNARLELLRIPRDLATFRAALAAVDTFRIARSASALTEEELDEDSDVDPETPAAPDPDAPFVPASDDPIDNPFITTL